MNVSIAALPASYHSCSMIHMIHTPEDTWEVHSPEDTWEVHSPEDTWEVHSPEDTCEVHSPEAELIP
ncbi:unnamed protein product [Lota lota]